MPRLKLKPVAFRRKREQKTYYPKRIALLTSGLPRVVVRFTNRQVIAQVVEYRQPGDKVIVALDSSALKAQGWPYSGKNFPAAYLTGLLLGRKAVAQHCPKAILDTGFKLSLKKGKVYAFLKGLLDSGLEVPHGDAEIFPDAERISGTHIQQYAQQLGKASGEKFSSYAQHNADPAAVIATFEKVKQNILKNNLKK